MTTSSPDTTSPALPGAAALQAVLDGRWGAVRDDVRALAADGFPGAGPGPEATLEQHRAYTTDQMRSLAALRFPRDGVSSELGGNGDPGATVTALETIAHVDLSLFVKAGVQFGLYGGAITNLGTQRHHQRYLEPMLAAEELGCFAMTETGHGSNVQALETTATYDPDGDELVIHSPTPHARKDYIGNAARDARMAAVFAQLRTADGTGHGVHCVLVPIRDAAGTPMPGVSIGDCGAKAGLLGVDNGRLTFDKVRVPRTNLLNRYGDISAEGVYSSPIENPDRRFFTMLGTLVRGRVSVAAGAGAATRSALTIATRYALRRKQFGRPGLDGEVPLISYRAHQRKLMPAIATSYALAIAQNQLTEMMDAAARLGEGVPEAQQRDLEARAAGLKAVTTATATATIQMCREACGGAGYLSANRLPQLKADTDVFTTFEGDNTVLLQLVAKGLLSEFRSSSVGGNPLAILAFASRFTASSWLEHMPVSGRVRQLISRAPSSDTDHAERDRGRQLALFRDRERHLIESVAMRLGKASRAEGEEAFTIFNAAQDHLVTAAEAHVHRVVLEAFDAAIDASADAAVADLLDDVCDLYALSLIEKHRGWYLEHGRMSSSHTKDVVRDVGALCEILAPRAGLLVDAFAIPDSWLTTETLHS